MRRKCPDLSACVKKSVCKAPKFNFSVYKLLLYLIVLEILYNVSKRDHIYELQPWEENAGILKNVDMYNISVVLCFFSSITNHLVGIKHQTIRKLKNAIGKTVNILRTDIIGKEYCLKIFDEEV